MLERYAVRSFAPSPWKGLVAGAGAGLVGTLVMTGLQVAWSRPQRSTRDNGSAPPSSDEPATVKAARSTSRLILRRDIPSERRARAGQVVHYGFGTGVGALYGLAVEYSPAIAAAHGAPFGTGLMLAADEIAVPAFGFSAPPTRQPASTHVQALVAHIVYAVTVEGVRGVLRYALDGAPWSRVFGWRGMQNGRALFRQRW
jgi:putative membrane protein